MIESLCTCGQPFSLPESACATTYICPDCQTRLHLVCGESLPAGAATGDFDARLVVEKGPHGDRVGQVYLLGGVAQVTLGKLSTSNILLPGTNVSRHHATLTRLDFGPSQWQIEDNHSTNGLWINDSRCSEPHELRDNDLIVVGDYELRYQHSADPTPVATAAVAASAPSSFAGHSHTRAGGRTCPSCAKTLPANAKICIDCGIYLDTGRPLLTAKGFDENDLHVKAENAIRIISWLSPTGFYPVASEGFGTHKPLVLWALVIVTILTTLLGFIVDSGTNRREDLEVTANYELWAGDPNIQPELPDIREVRDLSPAERDELRQLLADRPHGDYHPHQFVTHAFLHGGFMHLAGNMLFMIVLGVSVCSLIGNLQLAILYPILAVAGGVAHFIASRHGPVHPMVGASGAIMGLAGMYLVLFPVHKMYMAAWWRWGLFRGFRLSWKLWQVRGFWVVLFYISFDVVFTALGVRDNTAHWAHLGGFMAGIVVAVLLLVTRLVNARGGDLLSVTLGRHAWALLGKPSSRVPDAAPPAPPAPVVPITSLNFPE